MFTIVISEKGGAERRETFEKTEITVGRVQGNDLMLPKGNVSKHHARLLCRDGRFIVTDLKSTNGTYVNGRKTSQATIVREGDKIYIGDFVLRVETGQAVLGAPSVRSEVTVPRPPPGGPPASATGLVPGQLAGPPPAQARAQELSHYPLERDPDSESAPELTGAAMPVVPGPPRVPQTVGLRPGGVGGVPAALPRGTTAIQPVRARSPEPRQPAPVDGVGWRETRKQSARRVALITLVDRVADVVDLAPLDRSPEIEPTVKEQVERAIREQTKAMRADGEVPEGVDPEQLAADAARELLSLGPLGPALEDDEVSEIHVARADSVVVEKKGERQLLADGLFTSEEAVARAVARLAQRSGEPLRAGEVPVERRLPSGATLVAVGPPASRAWVLTLRKRGRVEGSVEELVRAGSMSRPMADFLEACVLARCNLLIVGSGPGTVSSVLSALASTSPTGQRIAVLHEGDEIVVTGSDAIALWDVGRGVDAERLGSVASRLGVDRLVIASLGSAAGLTTLDAIGEGCQGVLAGYGAPTLRHGLARLAARLSLARPGISSEAAGEGVASSFDIGVEVAREASGKLRVHRISEVCSVDPKGSGPRDVFVSSLDAGGVSFAATGVTPKVAQDFAARGIKVDASLFVRSQ